MGAYISKPSDSPYGTFDQGGGLWEWNEGDIFGDGSSRGLRGGSFYGSSINLRASYRYRHDPPMETWYIGFRVAEVPEPATIALLALGGAVVMRQKR